MQPTTPAHPGSALPGTTRYIARLPVRAGEFGDGAGNIFRRQVTSSWKDPCRLIQTCGDPNKLHDSTSEPSLKPSTLQELKISDSQLPAGMYRFAEAIEQLSAALLLLPSMHVHKAEEQGFPRAPCPMPWCREILCRTSDVVKQSCGQRPVTDTACGMRSM